jgi:hypothetical protein
MNLDQLIEKHKLLQNVRCGIFVPTGWIDLVDELMIQIEDELKYCKVPESFTIDQVKEKFGGLRVYSGINEFYDDDDFSVIDLLIKFFENESFSICEVCGKKGKLTNKNHWLKTLCEDHVNEIYSN